PEPPRFPSGHVGQVIASKFVHLHTHSEYSLLDGLSRLSDLVARAKALEMPALALTDHGALYGAIDFYTLCRDAGIKPIVGIETYVARNSRLDRDARVEGHGKPFHLVLLAKDFTGYQNLVALVTAAHLEGYYYRPRMDKELLRERSAGLIALSACLQGELARAIEEDGIDAACRVAEEHRAIFGEGNYYLELMSHGLDEQARVNEGVRKDAGGSAPRDGRSRVGRALRRAHAAAQGADRQRAHCHREDGLHGLHPHRPGLHPLRA